MWPLPLFSIHMERMEDDSDLGRSVNFVLSKGGSFFGEVNWRVCSGGVLEAQCLLHGHVEEIQILNCLESHDLAHKVFLAQVRDRRVLLDHLLPSSSELFPDFRKTLWVLREVG